MPFAKDMGSRISLLTQHHYPKGPPNNPSVTISNLLSPDQRLDYLLQNLRIAAQQQGLKYRITESNSVFSGGKEGVSNVFAAALWATDFMFILAQNEAMGVNFHGGGLGLYTPIAEEINKNFFARPLYYGILLFKLASQGRFLPITISQNTLNLKVYAVLGWNNNVMLTLINKDETQSAQVLIDLQDRITVVSALRLSAPSLSSTSNITLGGSSVNSDGSWTPGSFENIQKSGNYYSVLVPAASAALITLP
ncbi:glycosyl hydrolase family 79 C-terminal domain-containing protein, partial [Nostoc sp. MG11]|uniref:glycosyl hydrolase family 79 C-terminal domain-containing protein n=1 Tax=Nostoc sp. MG11 TaxID=2721166 RepID=UPI0029FF133A